MSRSLAAAMSQHSTETEKTAVSETRLPSPLSEEVLHALSHAASRQQQRLSADPMKAPGSQQRGVCQGDLPSVSSSAPASPCQVLSGIHEQTKYTPLA